MPQYSISFREALIASGFTLGAILSGVIYTWLPAPLPWRIVVIAIVCSVAGLVIGLTIPDAWLDRMERERRERQEGGGARMP